MTAKTRQRENVQASSHKSGWLWLAQVALALILFGLLTGLWAYLWISSSF
jgi:hypothetical protein